MTKTNPFPLQLSERKKIYLFSHLQLKCNNTDVSTKHTPSETVVVGHVQEECRTAVWTDGLCLDLSAASSFK